MLAYIFKRVVQIAILMFLVVALVFVLVHMAPGDPAWTLAGEQATAEYVEYVRHAYGLDKPISEQLFIYLSKVIHGDLGYSFAFSRPVLDVILERLPATLLLIGPSLVLTFVLGSLIGIYAAKKHLSKTGKALSGIFSVIYAIPIPWSGLLTILVFAYWLRLFPVAGMTGLRAQGSIAQVFDILHHAVLPTFIISTFYLPPFVRVAKESALEVMKEDFVTTARAMGFDEKTVLIRHIMRNALLPSVTLFALRLGLAFAGALITETVFSWPGLGRLGAESILYRDYPLIIGIFIFVAISMFVISLVVDIIYTFIDPRVTLT